MNLFFEESGDFKAGNVTSFGIAQPVSLEVYTTTGALHDTEPWGDVQRVTYELKDSTDRTSPARQAVINRSANPSAS